MDRMIRHSLSEKRSLYLKRAQHAEEKAVGTQDIQVKIAWVSVAASWRQMAEELDDLMHMLPPDV